MQTTYQTKRLILKLADPDMSEALCDYCTRNRTFLEEWEPAHEDGYFTIAFQRKLLEQEMNAHKTGLSVKMLICKKESPTRVIGTVHLGNIVRGIFLSCFAGYGMDGNEINNGYMTEALGKMIEIAFDELKLHRIEANIMPKNKRSLRVVQKLGFENEGLSKKYLKINGIWEDHIHMVLLNDRI